MFCPGLTGFGGAGETTVFVIARFACGPTAVVTLALLFDDTGSESELGAEAVFTIVSGDGDAVQVNVIDGSAAPLASDVDVVVHWMEPLTMLQVQSLAADPPTGVAPPVDESV